MKKSFQVGFVLIIITVLLDAFAPRPKSIVEERKTQKKEEIRAIYVSYIELNEYLADKSKNQVQEAIQEITKNIKKENFNWIILHTRSFSDSIYPSQVFPTSYMITRDENQKLEVDILEEFIEASHKQNIKVHAWINPYRIRNGTDFSTITPSNPCFKWIGTNHIKKIEGKGIFYNPASLEAQDLIVKGITEIVEKYQVDGIHFDDYFYPDKTIDLENYQEYQNQGGELSIDKYRLENVNNLIKRVYQEIHNINKSIVFGIAPDGNIRNNYQENYADILTWLKEENYVDYIMPQLYYGFKNETKPFTETLNEWNNYIENKNILLIPALALYKAGNIDNYAKSGSNEWIEHQNILERQIQIARNVENYKGFAIFRYDNFFKEQNSQMTEEVANIRTLLKEEKFLK